MKYLTDWGDGKEHVGTGKEDQRETQGEPTETRRSHTPNRKRVRSTGSLMKHKLE